MKMITKQAVSKRFHKRMDELSVLLQEEIVVFGLKKDWHAIDSPIKNVEILIGM
tara:strand:+ start:5817 stop:5978 length:162 start_codon:yes stop_codon:yes gene_type:complete